MAGFPPMTDKAAEAFADYASMKPGKRSLRGLAEEYAAQNRYRTATTAFSQLRTWSSKYQWPERIAEAVTSAVTRKLEMAAELDADTFLETSKRLNETIHGPGFIGPADVTRIRESVRKPEPKGGTSVSVQLDVQLSQVVERIAEAEGLNEIERAEFQKDVEKYLAEVNS